MNLNRVLARRLILPALLAAVACFSVVAPTQAGYVPDGKTVASVYCGAHGKRCTKVYGAGPTRYGRPPHGYSSRLRCRWYNGGWSRGLQVHKYFCVRT